MLNPKDYSTKRINAFTLLHDRCMHSHLEYAIRKRLHTHPSLMRKLELDAVLYGHDGCINCLEWSSTGRILASGSDDFQLCLWNPFRQKRIHSFHTKHCGNMFSVKFLPKHNDALIATAAADKTIMLFDINHSHEAIYTCHCHEARVKRLATAPDSPYVFWSAGEDGNILQLDHRERHACRSRENRVCLLNLRTFMDSNAEAKCIAVNPARTEQIAIGANDPYARVYDRRMLVKTSSVDRNQTLFPTGADGEDRLPNKSNNSLAPKDGVAYFCPGHITKNISKIVEHESRAITYLTFNPCGTELLVNMGSEHIYIYDLLRAKVPVYLSLPELKESNNNSSNMDMHREPKETKLSRLPCSTLVSTETEINNKNSSTNPPSSLTATVPPESSSSKANSSANVSSSRCKLPTNIDELKTLGNEFLENEKYLKAISLYSEAIGLDSKWPVLYLNRATAYMRRLWFGDIYAALRDCHVALSLDTTYIKAHFRLARALLELGRLQDADECLQELIKRFPSYANNHGVLMLNKDIRENRQMAQHADGQSPNSSSTTSNARSNVGRSGTGREGTGDTSEAAAGLVEGGSPPTFGYYSRYELSNDEYHWRTKARDYSQRFVGHCNITTDIKEANYFGHNNDYIVAGSDDGNFFIWDRHTCNIHSIYKADSAIVNCVLPNPHVCMIATSGIDYSIKIWSPMNFDIRPNVLTATDHCVEKNQMKMKSDPFDISTRNYLCWNG